MFVELREPPVNLFVQLVEDPLKSCPVLQCIDSYLQFGVIH